ncbi:class I SAM-dependent methyltransferase [Glutamicibacter sp. MNS18]|uniref:class I SAM-dependent methyltransferase n=1 Tax=Glutamicibacter sp. MNS18 TaxID=2989817 RepID=UPI002235A522|nr:class I SAM-dependent methyltransferase [Glutamicibacter sp. MNS18]MCW4465003.1 class I SAM-dependent methyltransferase [Glutamicibacter sp. MNS18]
MNAPKENLWLAAVRANPDHARNYAERWRGFVEQGRDIYGEARLVDAMADRGSRILDAGCGTGRIGGWLAERGHEVFGVDLDEHLVSVARQDYPQARWSVGNLADFGLVDESGAVRHFDLIVSAGNVLTFLAQAERLPALQRLREHLAAEGRLIVGFGSGRGYAFDEFAADAARAGLQLQQRYSTWQLHGPADDFLVAVLGRSGN